MWLISLSQDRNLTELVSSLNVVVVVFLLVFMVCDIAEDVNFQFEFLAKKLYQYDWYLLPIRMQRIYLIFMAHTQQTPHIQGFGNIVCSREIFKKVC